MSQCPQTHIGRHVFYGSSDNKLCKATLFPKEIGRGVNSSFVWLVEKPLLVLWSRTTVSLNLVLYFTIGMELQFELFIIVSYVISFIHFFIF
jgi:hypothetical protein